MISTSEAYLHQQYFFKGFELLIEKLRTMPEIFSRKEYVDWLKAKIEELDKLEGPKFLLGTAVKVALDGDKEFGFPELIRRDEFIQNTELALQNCKRDKRYSVSAIQFGYN